MQGLAARRTLCLHRGVALYIGELPEIPLHSTIASSIVFAFNENLSIRLADEIQWRSAECFLVSGAAIHTLKPPQKGPFGVIFADPGSETGLWIKGELGADEVRADPIWRHELIEAGHTLHQASSLENTAEILAGVRPFRELSPVASGLEIARLAPVLRRLVESADEPVNIKDLARFIGMSPSWLQHKFRGQIGVPITSFRTWIKIKLAVMAIKEGAPLVDAALAGGFYDQAHFTNTFRAMFGYAPSQIFKPEIDFRWYIENEELARSLVSATGT